jgi:hypothetical protein
MDERMQCVARRPAGEPMAELLQRVWGFPVRPATTSSIVIWNLEFTGAPTEAGEDHGFLRESTFASDCVLVMVEGVAEDWARKWKREKKGQRQNNTHYPAPTRGCRPMHITYQCARAG